MLTLKLSAVLVLASITESLADIATRVVGDLGLGGIFLLMVPESSGIPIPSEATMLFAGFNVSEGRFSLLAAVVVASVANVVGSLIAYAIGYYGRDELLEKHLRFFHLSESHLAWGDRWFAKYGAPAVFFSRMLPVVRTFISFPAGAARMPLGRFTLLTFLGALPWNFGLCLAGKSAKDNWVDIKDKLHYVDYGVVALILLGAGYLAVRWYRGRGDDGPGTGPGRRSSGRAADVTPV
ncbi:DedA family protein [Paraconexibacter antarcticus]|uniref:DedA family protein n=1 Tax=Paraconexibacter antarcticus TaxID=2949664 RepID=A0ABY5DTA6_9ACTN|nr:DedA family protein [Paraconexibacter antarcticus]UTI64705.1 DedA family protein [Paraconexibacter antarcticus]